MKIFLKSQKKSCIIQFDHHGVMTTVSDQLGKPSLCEQARSQSAPHWGLCCSEVVSGVVLCSSDISIQ